MNPLSGWTRPDRGVLFVVTGPSGVGKSTLIHRALDRIDGLAFSVSATTRPMRDGEVDGFHYHFRSHEHFAELVEQDAFLEWATVYGESYGTLREPTQQALARGESLILDIDVQGAERVRGRMSEAVSVFVLPPDLAALKARLIARNTDGPEVIARRMEQVEGQLRGCSDFDYLVMNDHLPTALTTFEAVLLAEMSRRSRRQTWIADVARQLAGSSQ